MSNSSLWLGQFIFVYNLPNPRLDVVERCSDIPGRSTAPTGMPKSVTGLKDTVSLSFNSILTPHLKPHNTCAPVAIPPTSVWFFKCGRSARLSKTSSCSLPALVERTASKLLRVPAAMSRATCRWSWAMPVIPSCCRRLVAAPVTNPAAARRSL